MRPSCKMVWIVCVAGVSAILCARFLAALPARAESPAAIPTRPLEFDTDEGTWMNLDVSPDGKKILFDLLGDLYTLPINGGEAKRLLGGPHWDCMPRYSPNGKTIVFASDRDEGTFNLWLADADGANVRQLTKERIVWMSSPAWTPDGQYIMARRMLNQTVGIVMVDLRGGSGIQIQPQGAEPALSQDGRFLYFTSYSDTANIARFDRSTGHVIQLTRGSGMWSGVRPAVSPDGRLLAYATQREGVASLRLRDLETGDDRELAATITDVGGGAVVGHVPTHAFTPDGRSLLVPIRGKIHRIDVKDGADHLIPFRARVSQQIVEPIRSEHRVQDGDLEVRVLRWPSLSPDSRQLAFNALGRLYLMDLPDGRPRRLTKNSEREYYPCFSPDGSWIAYTTWSDAAYGQVKLVSPNGKRERVLTQQAGRYGNPAWSRDGTKLAFVRGSGGERRSEWDSYERYFELWWADLRTGERRLVTTVAPPFSWHRWFPTIAFSPDGSRLLYLEGSNSAANSMNLVSVRLDGSDLRKHVKTSLQGDVIPSPDGRHVAILSADALQVIDLPPAELHTPEIDATGGSLPSRRYVTGITVQPSWHGKDSLIWTIGNRLYRQKLGAAEPEEVAQVRLVASTARPAGKIAFTNARLITMNGDEVIPRGTLLVDRNRIAAVGPSERVVIPADALVVDARGKTILPGLIDTHMHGHDGNREFHPGQPWEYVAQLAYGVTTVFDPQAPTLDVFARSEMVAVGEMLGSRVYSSGRAIWGGDPGSAAMYFALGSLEDARRVVRAYRAYAPLMLKDYLHYRRDEHRWLAQAARESGLRLTAEGNPNLLLLLTLVTQGYTGFEHDLPLRIHNDVVQLMARSGVYYTPTLLSPYGGKGAKQYFRLRTRIHEEPKARRFMPGSYTEGTLNAAQAPEYDWFFKTVAEDAAKILRAGGRVTTGGHGELHGLGLLWEAWGIGMGGLTPLETIRVATLYGAEKLGLQQDLGSLEPGKLADLLVLDANPLEDIQHLARQRYVVKHGFVYDSESMTQLWPDYKPLPKFFWMSEAEWARFKAPAPQPLAARGTVARRAHPAGSRVARPRPASRGQ
jgi:Tol biopolymer transport system component/imidazolonepropionase-like amidohydrolase